MTLTQFRYNEVLSAKVKLDASSVLPGDERPDPTLMSHSTASLADVDRRDLQI